MFFRGTLNDQRNDPVFSEHIQNKQKTDNTFFSLYNISVDSGLTLEVMSMTIVALVKKRVGLVGS